MADERTERAKYLRVESLVYETPLAVSRDRLDTIITVLDRRAAGETTPLEAAAGDTRAETPELVVTADGIAILPVMGTFVKRAGMMDALSGLTSYGAVERQFRALVQDDAVRGILLQIDSPGGQVNGMFDLARYIRSATQAKPVWALADDAALSAAYAIASGADRVLVTETGWLGSIGAIMARRDVSGDESRGRTEFFSSGAHKTDGNPEVALTDPERKRLQGKVDQVGAMFHALVADHRGMSVATVAAQEAGTFIGQAAVEAGLADGVATLASAVADLTAHVAAQSTQQHAARRRMGAEAPATARGMSMETNSTSTTNVVDLEAHRRALDEARTAGRTEAAAEYRQRTKQIETLCAIGGCPARAAAFIASDLSVEQISAALLEERAAASAAEVVTITKGTPEATSPRLDVAAIYAARQAAIDEAAAKRVAPARVS